MNVSFRQYALSEAERYGSDGWVFLRELLQNARDAGASKVTITTSQVGDLEGITFHDDGRGMSAEHARRYLFALYASSKEEDPWQAGQFGVGFWSVLRFKPERLEIRSCPAGGEAWRVRFGGELDDVPIEPDSLASGTEIRVERRRRRRELSRRVFRKASKYGRFLTCLDRPGTPLEIVVDGVRVNARLTLPAPSATFERLELPRLGDVFPQGFRESLRKGFRGGLSRGGRPRAGVFRGAVGLGREPRVELFANGLFIRRATCLADLLEDDTEATAGGGLTGYELPGSLAPQVLLDSSHLEPLLARRDVRETRHLRRLVHRAEAELERLVERQLSALRRPSFLGALRLALRRGWALLRRRRLAAGLVVLGFAVALLARLALVERPPGDPPLDRHLAGRPSSERPEADRPVFPVFPPAVSSPAVPGTAIGYTDLGARYAGPRIDPLAAEGPPIDLRFEPPVEKIHLAALRIDRPEAWFAHHGAPPEVVGPYAGPECLAAECLTIFLRLAPSDVSLRLPVPTGHRLDPASVRLDGEARKVYAGRRGEAILTPVPNGGRLEYRTAPAAEGSFSAAGMPEVSTGPVGLDGAAELLALAELLQDLPLAERVRAARVQVAGRIAYDRTAAAVDAYREARAGGLDFTAAALAIGRGDCDVQNGVLVHLLRLAGVEARLAIGYLGRRGEVASILHAWVEYLDAEGRWRVVDASTVWSPRPSAGALADSDLPSPGPRVPGDGDDGIRDGGFGGLAGRRRGAEEGRDLGGVAAVGFGVLTAFLLGVFFWRGRPRRKLRLTADGDLSALIGGALLHPELGDLPALWHSDLVPLIRGRRRSSAPSRALSLHRARRLALAGRLYASPEASPLAIAAARRGAKVIDATTAAGRTAALGLGAIDLDEWSELRSQSAEPPLVEHLNAHLERAGGGFRIAVWMRDPVSGEATASPDASRIARQPTSWFALRVLDLEPLGLGSRQVLIDPEHGSFAEIRDALDRPSPIAAFRLLDRVVEKLDLETTERARLLAGLARRAVTGGGR